jgi:hypothetical protein
MKAGMRLVALWLVAWLVGCVQLPSVSLRVRARFERDASRSARSLEARVDCGWSFERRAGRAATAEPEHEHRERSDGRALRVASKPSPCALPSACAWEEQSRAAALAVAMPESPIDTGGAR